MNKKTSKLEKDTIFAAQELAYRPGRVALVLVIDSQKTDSGLAVDYCLHGEAFKETHPFLIDAMTVIKNHVSNDIKKLLH